MKVNLFTSLLLAMALYHETVSTAPVGKCPDIFDSDHLEFLAHTDCTKFYICSQSGPVEKNCPSGLHWNAAANVCDWPELARCVAGSAAGSTTVVVTESTLSTVAEVTSTTPSETSSITTTNAPSSTVTASGKCPEVFDPQTVSYLPHPDCSKYYICTPNGPLAANCPPGLHWSQQWSICNWPELAGCIDGRGALGECPTQYDPENEVFLPDGSDCAKYYLCTWDAVAVVQNCPAGLHWNRQTDQCDWPADAGCALIDRDPLFKNQR